MAKDAFTEEEKKTIVNAIKAAELETSGEIQVHLENHCKEDVLDHAAHIFKTLKMHKTELRNGVLFYMAIKDHKFAILGDVGINQKVPENFWDDIKEHMMAHFKKGNLTAGLSEGIKMARDQLAAHFPFKKDDANELPDEISFGKS
ncbi:TPM domain-containing protein [Marivirga sp.]|uniref:TPM domain-containing protein n=1 Tax=Marivirga sp. TaxID=2018662 RepID=UPI003DA73A7E